MAVDEVMDMALHEKELRLVYGETLVELGGQDDRIVALDADLMNASGTTPFKEAFPERHFDVGVAEANMMGIAAGLSTVGKVPFCATFTPFASRRAYDQVTISVAYANRNVKIIGTAPGVTAGANGGTHMCFQDLAIMRVMPNMTVLSPADAYEVRAALRWMAAYEGPVYMQLLRPPQPALFNDDYIFLPGRAIRLTTGQDATLISCGYATRFAREAVQILNGRRITVEHLHVPTIKPLDADTLVQSARKTGFVVTVENQSILGGLGGAVCELLAERCPTRVKRLGVPDRFGEIGTEEFLMDKHGFAVPDIVNAVVEGIR